MNTISFENVSKKYKLYSKGGLYMRDRITHALRRFNPFNGRAASHGAESKAQSGDSSANRPLPSVHSSQPLALGTEHALERDFWALKNVSFEIKQGESVGFIGRNGAGKSTILKLLAGVTKASSGTVEVNGKVAALIEVGAGFHPELTGRENIYLNGSILGMKKAEIEKQFDSIVSFAELEDFIDTPVKYYSSGMYVRLGFAIAAHTNPDIYLIDEVLAVGDESFQKKCLDTLAAHKAAGKTMILVSHALDRIEEACDRCIYVNHGEIRYDGTPYKAIDRYRTDLSSKNNSKNRKDEVAANDGIQIVELIFRDADGKSQKNFASGDTLVMEIRYRASKRIEQPNFGVAIHGSNGEHLAGFNMRTSSVSIESIQGEGSVFCRLDRLPFQKGTYAVRPTITSYDYAMTYDHHDNPYHFTIESMMPHSAGTIYLQANWVHDEHCKKQDHEKQVLKNAS